MDSPPPAETLQWRTARITVWADRSWAVKANSNDPEQSTIGHEDGDDLVQPSGDGRLETLTEDQWCIVEVLPRGKTMYDNNKFKLQAEKRKRKKNLHDQINLTPSIRTIPDQQWNDGFDLERQERWEAGERQTADEPQPVIRTEPTVDGLYLGYSSYMTGPVFVRPVNAGNAPPSVRHQVSCFNFEGTEFKVEPAGCVAGRQTIPHYLATIPANLRAIKEFVNNDSKKFSTIFRFGSHTLKEVREQTVRSAVALACGAKLVPVAKYKALTNQEFEIALRDLEALSHPESEAGPHNPPWKDRVCDGAILRRKTRFVSGFEFSVPYLKALSIPPKLTRMLHEFGLKFPNDLLTIEDLLLGLFAWYDIVTCGKQEPSVSEVRKSSLRPAQSWELPHTSLCECLLAYPHYLRWTEEMCLAEYPHFSRYVYHMFKEDRKRDSLVVRGVDLDEAEVKRLMMQITSKVEGVTPAHRLKLLSHMMPGSRMPRMINIEPYVFPTKAKLVMTGLTSVYLKGLPTYIAHDTPPEYTPLIKLCVPKRLAANSFIGNMRPLEGTRWEMEDLEQMKGEFGLLTFPYLKAGPVWERDMDTMSQLFEDPSERGPPPEFSDPNWSLMDDLGSFNQVKYMHRQLHSLQHAVETGGLSVGEGRTVTIDENGFISVVGGPPVTEEILRRPTITHVHGNHGRENFDAMLRQAAQTPPTEDADLQGPCPLVEDVMQIIESSPIRRHYIWSALYRKLSADQPDIPEKTSEGLLRALIDHVGQEQAVWSRLALLSSSPRIQDLILVAPLTLSKAICELAGICIEDGETDPFALLAEVDQDLEEWAKDLIAALEKLIQQASGVQTGHSNRIEQRRKLVLEYWTTVCEMLAPGKMEPRFRQLLVRLRDMQPDPSDITLPEPEAGDLELHTEQGEEGSSAAPNHGNIPPVPSSSLDSNVERQASWRAFESSRLSPDTDMDEAKVVWRDVIDSNRPPASSSLSEDPVGSNVLGISRGPSSSLSAPASRSMGSSTTFDGLARNNVPESPRGPSVMFEVNLMPFSRYGPPGRPSSASTPAHMPLSPNAPPSGSSSILERLERLSSAFAPARRPLSQNAPPSGPPSTLEPSGGPPSAFSAPATRLTSENSLGGSRARPESDSNSDDRDGGSIKRQRLSNSPPLGVRGESPERPHSLSADTDQDEEDTKEDLRAVIDLTDLDDEPEESTAQDIAGPSTPQPTEPPPRAESPDDLPRRARLRRPQSPALRGQRRQTNRGEGLDRRVTRSPV